jgi:hypothetical protein
VKWLNENKSPLVLDLLASVWVVLSWVSFLHQELPHLFERVISLRGRWQGIREAKCGGDETKAVKIKLFQEAYVIFTQNFMITLWWKFFFHFKTSNWITKNSKFSWKTFSHTCGGNTRCKATLLRNHYVFYLTMILTHFSVWNFAISVICCLSIMIVKKGVLG